jgi:23S rRNA pseudouridine2457 synthase
LRLIRYRIGDWTLEGLAPGQWRDLVVAAPARCRPDPGGYRLPRRV